MHKAAIHKHISFVLVVLLILGFLCLGVAGFLGYQVLHQTSLRLAPIPRQTNVNLIQGWMTIRYISHTYKVPEEVFAEKFHLSLHDLRSITVDTLAKRNHKPSFEILQEIRTIIITFQSYHPVLHSS